MWFWKTAFSIGTGTENANLAGLLKLTKKIDSKVDDYVSKEKTLRKVMNLPFFLM